MAVQNTGFWAGLFNTADKASAGALTAGQWALQYFRLRLSLVLSPSPAALKILCSWKISRGKFSMKKRTYSIEIPVVEFGMFLMGCSRWGHLLLVLISWATDVECSLLPCLKRERWCFKSTQWKIWKRKRIRYCFLSAALHVFEFFWGFFFLLGCCFFVPPGSWRQLGCGPWPGLLASAAA